MSIPGPLVPQEVYDPRAPRDPAQMAGVGRFVPSGEGRR